MRQNTVDTINTDDTDDTVNTDDAVSEYGYARGAMRRHLTYSVQVAAGNDVPHCSIPTSPLHRLPSPPPSPPTRLARRGAARGSLLPSAICHLVPGARWSRLEHTLVHPRPRRPSWWVFSLLWLSWSLPSRTQAYTVLAGWPLQSSSFSCCCCCWCCRYWCRRRLLRFSSSSSSSCCCCCWLTTTPPIAHQD